MADGVAADRHGRPGLRPEMEHGLDARHARVHAARTRSTGSYHHGQLTFSLIYAFNENFVLPLSHDEVVYGKGSLIGKMPGDDWQKFANLRALFGYMWGHPGKKLLFMGGEFGQRREWTHEGELEWWVTELPEHAGVQRLGARPESRLPQRARAASSSIFSQKASSGSTSTMRCERHRVPAQGARAARRCSWCATSRRCRAATTWSACRSAGSGAKSSTATRANTAARAGAIWAASSRCR